MDYREVVLSPGPGLPEESGNLLKVIEHYEDKLPILGICLGDQTIRQFFNAPILKADKPMHGKMILQNWVSHNQL